MKLKCPLPHRKARIEIIPLIDIMFFLLASFMLVSMNMVKVAGVKMALPKAATGTPEPKADFLPISLSASGEVFWDQDAQPISNEALASRIQPLLAANPDLRISINADRAATHGAVIDLLDRIRQAGVLKVSFAVHPAPPVTAKPAPSP